MNRSGKINRWGIVQLYVAALKKAAWIEALSLGYTLLEMQLRHLASSTARAAKTPLPNAQIERCKYLMEIVALTRDEGFLPTSIFDRVKAFNDARILAIHKLLTETVEMAELPPAQSVTPLYGDIQNLWLKITISPRGEIINNYRGLPQGPVTNIL